MHRLDFVLHVTGNILIATVAVVIAIAPHTSPGRASDYYHMCRSVDGQYVMHDGTLQKAGPKGDGIGRTIDYKTLRTIDLKKRAGYCIASNGGNKFKYEARTYVQDIRFQADGRRVNLTMLCELAADGLPAAVKCAREVGTVNWSIRPQSAPNAGNNQANTTKPISEPHWEHNGSTMRLTAAGKTRRFYYVRPRSGLRKRGVREGELLFDGRRDGNLYSGTAYIFTQSCGKIGYHVSGTVAADDTHIVMSGKAPRLNSRCRQIGSKPDRLVFTLRR